ncbi:MAG: hypothetical protein KGZ72_02215 [Roseovarius sp.]|jgi:hypothetical protein|nr:hypothetical protein [Roseovarius sp.]
MSADTVEELEERPVATGQQTVAAMAQRSGRTFIPIRSQFVQAERTAADVARAGPLSVFVRSGDHRGLLAYLLVLTVASKEPWDARYPAAVWARALDIDVQRPAAAMSKVWKRLQDRNLVARQRHRRQAEVTPLREDASGDPYTRPVGARSHDRYLKLDHAFWEDGWYARLGLPAVAMLLVALAEKQGFELPYERGPDWYGVSADTVYRGFRELNREGLLTYTVRYRPEPLSEVGSVEVRRWYVQDPFARRGARPS